MSKVADSIRSDLEQAVAYAKGGADLRACGVHVPKRRRARDPHASRDDARGIRRRFRLQCQHRAPLGTAQAPAGGRDARLSVGYRPAD